MCEKNYNVLNNLISTHLKSKHLLKDETLWRVDSSAIEGRGLFANRDIQINEVIFEDHPLLLGPRAVKGGLSCTVCYTIEGLKPCGKNCGLPICEECETSEEHKKICEFILNSLSMEVENFSEISEEIFRSLTPLKALFLPSEPLELLHNLVGHEEKIHGYELKLIEPYLRLTEAQKNIIKIVCYVLDSNAFETLVSKNGNQISLRGLYPLSALANHCCSPNTTHLFTSEQKMIVKACQVIKKDTEIFTAYATILWNSQIRRLHLYRTKHFWCFCDRCKDPTEFGTNLNALKCLINDCTGIILPENINLHSNWICSTCKSNTSSKKIGSAFSALGMLLSSIEVSTPNHLVALIKNRLHLVVPMSNQIVVELKLRAIWMLGHGIYPWKDLTIDQLFFKDQLCRDIIEILDKLQLGHCKTQGLLLLELYNCLKEISRRDEINNLMSELEKIKIEMDYLLEAAKTILEGDVSFSYQ